MNGGHQRFQDWLTAGAEGDPPRDLAVHASVCTVCQQSIGALDQLAVVNTGLASMPEAPTGRERSRLVMAGRLGGAAAVLFSAAILGVGVSQLIGVSRPGSPVAQATTTPSPNQGVLGETATPQPSPSAEAAPSVAQETLTPLGTPLPTHAPAVTAIPRRTPAPTPLPPPTGTPVPTATPIPTGPFLPGAPTGLIAVPDVGGVVLTWSAPADDGGSPITEYWIYRDSSPGASTFLISVSGSSYLDATAGQGTWYYKVVAVNVVGGGPFSNEATVTISAPSASP